MSSFLAFIDAIQPISPNLSQALSAIVKREILPAQHRLLRPGEVARRVYFLETGLVRGYIFQRPEMHRIHHEYEKHANNYGNIVWWDMLFGTYHNPEKFTTSCGFNPPKEERLFGYAAF